jgi:hypothetical protein
LYYVIGTKLDIRLLVGVDHMNKKNKNMGSFVEMIHDLRFLFTFILRNINPFIARP